MLFKIGRASGGRPSDRAVRRGSQYSIEINSLNDLLKLEREEGPLIIESAQQDRPWAGSITIYDSYVE